MTSTSMHHHKYGETHYQLGRVPLGFFLFLLFLSFVTFAAPQEQFLDFNNAYVDVADSDALDLAGEAFTMSAWIKPATWGQNNQGRILDHGGGSGGAGWSLHLENKSSKGSPRALRIQVNNDSGFDGMSNSDVISLDVWQHVAVTFNAGTLTFYVNAIEVGQSMGVPVPLAINEVLRIGARASDGKRYFVGGIDEVRIWDSALTGQDIFDLMQQELTGLEPGLVAYYQFNESTGQIATDVSGNGHDGQLGSTAAIDTRDPTWTSGIPPVNQAPQVSAGVDHVHIWSAIPVDLNGAASDDGLPAGTLSTNWSVVTAPDVVTFDDLANALTTATFGSPGTYVLRLTADDTILTSSDDLIIQLDAAAQLTNITITPDPVSLLVDNTQLFAAQGFDQTGAPFPATPNWSATGGTIDVQTGLYTAGGNVGQFNVTASDSGVSGQANVIITDTLAPWPTLGWPTATPQEMGLDQTLLEQARDYALTGGGSGFITYQGYLVMSWGSSSTLYGIKSTTKSIGSLILALALEDGLVQLNDLAQLHLSGIGLPPDSNADTGWLNEVSLLNLATQTAGFDKNGGFNDVLFQSGTTWAYTDGGVNWLADVLTTIYNEDLNTLAFNRIFTALGLTSADLTWRDNFYRPDLLNGVKRREFGSGIRTNVDSLARIGYLMLRGGQWDGTTLIPSSFVDQARVPAPSILGLPVGNDTQSRFNGASDHYGIMWWNNGDDSIAGLPTDAYWAWGLGDHLIVVIPSLDMVISRTGSAWSGSRDPSYYQVLEPFLSPIAQAVLGGPFNQAPTVDAGADQQITLPTNTVNLSGSSSDDGLPSGTLTTNWSLVAGPGTVTFGNSGALLTTAQFSIDGVYILQLSADDSVLTSTDQLTITVSLAPDLTVPNVTLTSPGAGVVTGTVTVSATASDNVAVASVEFRIDSIVIATDVTAPYSISWDSTTLANGVYTLTAIATDTSGNTAMDSVAVTVDNLAVNQAPTVDAGVDQQITLPTDTVNLSGTTNDDGLPSGTLTTTWSVLSGSGTVVFGDSASLATTAQFSTDGDYVLQITADDSEFSSSDQLNVSVRTTPILTTIVLTPANAQLAFGASLQFAATGMDQYGSSFTLNPMWIATGGTIDQTGLYLAGSTPGQFTVTATDGSVSTNATVGINDSTPTQKYLSFDNAYIDIADSPDLDLSGGAFTLSAWINPAGWGQNKQGRIFDHGGGSSGNAGWSLHLENKSSRGSPQALRMRINNDSGFNEQSDVNSIQLGIWQHVAITHDGNTLTFYVNGVQVGQTTGVPIPNDHSAPVRIGARATDTKRFFDGAIDEVRIWNVALTQQQVASQMSTEMTGTEPGLIAYYRFNEGTGQTAADATLNAHDGQLGSTAGADEADPVWQPFNQAPTVDAGADQQITLPTNTVNLSGSSSDDGLPSGTLTTNWSLVAGSGTVTFGNSGALLTTAQFSTDGVYILQLSADDSVLTSTDQLTIIVSLAPDLTVPNVTLTSPGAGVVTGTVTVSATASDNVAVASVEFRIDNTVIATDATAPYSISWDSTTLANGGYTLTAIATDTSGNTAMDSVTVTVDNLAVNQAPTVAAGIDQQITFPTDTVTLSGIANDDGLPSGTLTTTWSVVSGPGTVVFGNSTSLSTTAQFSTVGDYVLQISADDSEFSSSDQLNVSVRTVPVLTSIVLTPANTQLAFAASLQFTAAGVDQYSGSFGLNPVWSATGGSIDQTGLYSAGLVPGQFTVTVSDGSVSVNATVAISDSTPTQNYLSFDNAYVDIADNPDLDLSGGAFTLSAWINPAGWGQNNQGRIFDHGGGSSGSAGWSLHLENKSSRGSPQALRMRINNDSGFNEQSDVGSIQLGVWQHVAVTHDGNTLTFYVNGVQVGQTTGVPIPNDHSAPIRIGARATDTKRFFDGAIDEVRIWSVALTQPQVASQMSTELTGTESGLIAYYRFNEGAGQTAADASGNAHDGQLGSTAGADGADPIWQP